MQADVKGKRAEERKHLKVGVDLCSVDVGRPAHSGVTGNASSPGAPVLTRKALKSNQRLNVRSMLGSYRSRARVVYACPRKADYTPLDCSSTPVPGNGYRRNKFW